MSGQDIRSLYQEELIQVVREMGGRDFQGKQLFRWLHQKQVGSYQEMTDLPKAVRSQLEEGYPLTSLYPVDTQVSALDGTRKFLFALADGQMVESVWMHYLLPGRVPDGLPFLRVHDRRADPGALGRGDAGTGLCGGACHGKACVPRGGHGDRRAAG